MKNEKKKPETNVFLPRQIFNSLISALTYFIASKEEIGDTFFSKHSERLKSKILKHGRAFVNEGVESVSIYFYEIESAVLIKLLSYYISLGEKPTADFFAELENHEIKK